DFVASSAAALVSERTYKRHTPNKSTDVFQQNPYFVQVSVLNSYFRTHATGTPKSSNFDLSIFRFPNIG
ncbi:hypothetical protein, partial [Agrobacterium cavarae]|uniref:hypothetical protein n=1 Tax=Agrobacterium cavarae TaxID=2528239 RepID=UPI003FCF0D94